MDSAAYLGIDLGSTTLKAVLLSADGQVLDSLYRRAQARADAGLECAGACQACGRCNLGAVAKIMDDFLAQTCITRDDIARTVITGSQVVDDLARFVHFDAAVSEVSAHITAATHYHPGCRAVLDVGGQDSKAMLYDDDMSIWVSKMSGVCAAGTGAFLDSVAVRLNVPVEDMARQANHDSTLNLSSVCAVLSATSVNKFKNRYPLGDVIAAACRAQARTIVSGVGDLFLDYDGAIVFQGGVASNRAVAYYLQVILGNHVLIPERNQLMGALGAAYIARDGSASPPAKVLEDAVAPEVGCEEITPEPPQIIALSTDRRSAHRLLNSLDALLVDAPPRRKPDVPPPHSVPYSVPPARRSVAMRTRLTRQEFLANSNAPLVWRNLFFPAEILNALGVRMLTMETYAALRARNAKKLRSLFDRAARKGFASETCSFLRVLEGDDQLPKPDFVVGTSAPCQQGERILGDLARDLGCLDRYHLLHTPIHQDARSVETIAAGLEAAVAHLERALGIRMDAGRLQEACVLSNAAREYAIQCNQLRLTSPPLIRGSEAILFANIFSQLWGKKELVDLQRTLLEELSQARQSVPQEIGVEDTHRLVWLHLPPFYSSRLMDFVEQTCQAPVVFEEVNFVGWSPLDPNDPYRSLAQKLLTVGFLDPEFRASQIRQCAPDARVTGFVLYNHMFGRCSMADSCFAKRLRSELKKINMPLLVLDGDCLDETIDPCSTNTKVRAFIEALNVRKYGSLFGQANGVRAQSARPPVPDFRLQTASRSA